MTIRIPQDNFFDKILHLIGKNRAVRIPDSVYKELGPYAYAYAIKESFWKALMRPKGQDPPEGYFYAANFLKPPGNHN